MPNYFLTERARHVFLAALLPVREDTRIAHHVAAEERVHLIGSFCDLENRFLTNLASAR